MEPEMVTDHTHITKQSNLSEGKQQQWLYALCGITAAYAIL
jgi:hypothetical protein